MKKLLYFFYLTLTSVIIGIIGCSKKSTITTPSYNIQNQNVTDQLITEKEINTPNIYSISKFILNQLDEKGNPSFSLTSSKAVVNPITGNIDATDIVINIEGKDLLFNIISATKCIIDKEKNQISLEGYVELSGFRDKKSRLNADKILWDINAKKIYVDGNINLNYLSTRLNSSNATYDLTSEQFIFSGKTSYYVFKDDNNSVPLIHLKSDFATMDNKTKRIEFRAKSEQVRSVINLGTN